MVSLKVRVSVATETNGNDLTMRLCDCVTREKVGFGLNKKGWRGQTSQEQKPALVNTKTTGKVPRSL